MFLILDSIKMGSTKVMEYNSSIIFQMVGINDNQQLVGFFGDI